MTWLLPPAARYTTAEHGKPHEQIVSRATLYQMFGPDGSDRIFFCKACGNVLATTPAEKERIQLGLAQGSLSVHWLFETAGKSRGQFVELSRADYNPNWNPPMLLF